MILLYYGNLSNIELPKFIKVHLLIIIYRPTNIISNSQIKSCSFA